MTSLLLLKIIFVLANFLNLSKTLGFKYFRFISCLREIWILPISSAIRRHNDVRLRHCANQVQKLVIMRK